MRVEHRVIFVSSRSRAQPGKEQVLGDLPTEVDATTR